MNILEKTGKTFDALSFSEIKNKHSQSLELAPLQFKTSLSNIKLISPSEIEIITHSNKKIELNINQKSYEDFLALTLFNKKMNNVFLNILDDETKTIQMVNKFKNEYIHNRGDIPVTVFGSKNANAVIKIAKGIKSSSFIDNDSYLKNMYQLLNKYKLVISDFNVDNIGQIAINTFVDDNKPFHIPNLTQNNKFGNIENETFYRGLHFTANLGDYKIIPSTVRLLCSNQITLNQLEDSIVFNNLNMQSIKYINTKIKTLSNQNFLPNQFIKQVEKSYSIPASLNELEKVANIIMKHSFLEEKDLDEYLGYTNLKNNFNQYEMLNQFKLNHSMKTQLPIDKTVWQLTNVITYIAANAPALQITNSQRSELMMSAGSFLRGDAKNGFFDLQLKQSSPYSNLW